MTPFVRGKGTLDRLDNGITQWVPVMPPGTPAFDRWNRSYYVSESTIGDLAEWRLLLEQPVAPFQKTLFDNYAGKLILLFLILLLSLVLAEFLCRRIVVAIEQLRQVTCDLPSRLSSGATIDWPESGLKEVRPLVNNFTEMADSLSAQFYEIRQINESLEQRVEERTNQLTHIMQELKESEQKYRQLNETLEQRIKEAVNELREKDRMLIIQGRQAVMGEMIGNISHQWRQPLNMLGLLSQELQATYKYGKFSTEYINDNVKKTMELIRHMSKTIDDFRSFSQSDKDKVDFNVLEMIEKTLSLLEGSFKTHGISIEIKATGDPSISGYPNEFGQVLLNIVNNARDALLARKADSPTITIGLRTEAGKTVVTVIDNAGGIPEGIIDRVFDPYFTTKGPEKGTGIGLHMSKTIIEKHMNGTLSVRNVGNGAEFRIEM